MPVARINDKILHFIHVPKTGGSSVTSYMKTIGHVALYSREPINWSRSTPQHMEWASSEVMLPQGFVDVRFAVIRDPVQRLLSEFRYRFTRLRSSAAAVRSLDFKKPVTVEFDWGETFFGTFEEWVEVVFGKYESDPYTCDNHIRPQNHFVDSDATCFLFEYGILPVLSWIDEYTGVTGNLIGLDRNKSEKFPIHISKATRNRIVDFYEEDYNLIRDIRALQPAAPRC